MSTIDVSLADIPPPPSSKEMESQDSRVYIYRILPNAKALEMENVSLPIAEVILCTLLAVLNSGSVFCSF